MNADATSQILMIDDAISNLEVYKRILDRIPDVECIAYQSSAEALMWAADHDPDLVLVDYNMPVPNGLQFIEIFRKLPGKSMTPVVMITASREKEVRHRALDLGATDFLTKPADPVEFRARARNLLSLRGGQKMLAEHADWLAEEVRRATARLAEREREAILQLLRVAEFRDDQTANHIVRMGEFAALIGQTIDLPTDEVELLRLATPMHDIGKVATPDDILLKRGRLTPAEWTIMRQHSVAGYEILNVSKAKLLQTGAVIALTHHEKYDGSGYPHGMKGVAIPLHGRITALADVFDALTSERPYKKAWSIPEAVERIGLDRGTHFDPNLVDAFLTAIPEATAIKLRLADLSCSSSVGSQSGN